MDNESLEFDKLELEEEMKELFDDFNYNLNDKSLIDLDFEENIEFESDYSVNSSSNNNLIDEILNDQDYLNLKSISKDKNKFKNTSRHKNNIIDNEKEHKEYEEYEKYKKSNYKDEDILFENLDPKIQEDIVLKLRTDETTNQIISEEDPDIYHLNQLQFIKNDTYKIYFKGRKRKKSTSSDTEVEIELGKEEINNALEKENELIRNLINNIKKYFDNNEIKYNKNLFILSNFKGYRIIDNPIEDLSESCGIKIVSIMNNIGILSKYIYMSTDYDKIVVSKNFKNFKKIILNKIMFKKIKLDDIIYLIEKHK